MKITLMFMFSIILICSCSSGKNIEKSGAARDATANNERDGLSFESAIIIEAAGSRAGIDAEYAWLRKHYPGFKMSEQSLRNYENKPYDVISIITADGDEVDIYFDISNFFGKF